MKFTAEMAVRDYIENRSKWTGGALIVHDGDNWQAIPGAYLTDGSYTGPKLASPLNELPDSEFTLGGAFDEICRKAGYSSGKSAANDLGLWSASVGDAIDTILGE